METYDVQDGQRPEHISYDVYDTVDYYWVILLCNQIIDPYHDWPKSNIDLNNFAKQRYGELNLQKVHHYVRHATSSSFMMFGMNLGFTTEQANVF